MPLREKREKTCKYEMHKNLNWEESFLFAREGGEDWDSSYSQKKKIFEILTLKWIHYSQLSNWGGKECGIPWSCHNWLCDSSLLICWILYSSDGKGSLIWTPRRYPGSLAWNADFLRRTFHRYIRVSIIHTNKNR